MMTDLKAEPDTWAKGDWMQTDSGMRFYPLSPDPDDIRIEDIAHALALQCRYNGHCRVFYSVAQHSVIVSRVVPERLALVGLLHDAAEAYTGDIVRPMKLALRAVTTAWDDIELNVERAIAERFGIPPPPWPPEVKQADDVALMTERRDLITVQHPWTPRATPLPWPIVPLGPEEAEALFLARFREVRRRAREALKG